MSVDLMLPSKDTGWQIGYKSKTFNLLPTIHSPWGKGHLQIESEGWEKRFHANGQDRKAGVAVLISDKRDFKIKAIKKDKEG